VEIGPVQGHEEDFPGGGNPKEEWSYSLLHRHSSIAQEAIHSLDSVLGTHLRNNV